MALGKAAVVENSGDTLDSATPLCCGVSYVVRRRTHTLSFKEFVKFCPGELIPTIGTAGFDARAMLLLGAGSKGLVGFEKLIFGAEEGDARAARVVVCV